jgi:membrane protease YdiL (CAAX protease family)
MSETEPIQPQETLQPQSLPPEGPPLKDIVILYLLSSVLLLVFGTLLQTWHLLIGLVVTEVVLVVGPPFLYTLWYRQNVAQTFHLAPIQLKTALLVVVTTVAAFVLVGFVALLQSLVFRPSQVYQDIWEHVFQQFQQIPVIIAVLVVAVLPGICEELFFRGFLLHGLRNKTSDWSAIVLAGLLFGVFHLDVYRFFPVTLLGILFGYMVVKTGSIFTGMIAHATNNTIALAIAFVGSALRDKIPVSPQVPSELPSLQMLIPLIPILMIALSVFFVGIRALPRASDAPM